jgi:hypothetical protein
MTVVVLALYAAAAIVLIVIGRWELAVILAVSSALSWAAALRARRHAGAAPRNS